MPAEGPVEEPVEARPAAPPEDPSLIDVAGLALALGTDLDRGLDAETAASRLRADGPNELRALPPVPIWRRALAQFRDPLVYLLGAAAAVALAAWWFEGRGHAGAAGWPLDAIVIAAVVVLNAVLGWLQETKAAQAVAALAKMTTATSAVLRDGAVARVPSAELVKGDMLVLAEGDAVGADARLVQAAALKLLEAPLTGESEAVLKDVAPLAEPAALGDRLNMVFKGTAVAQGTGRAVVTATGMQTEMGSIATLLDTTPDAPTPLQVEIAHLGKVLGIAALTIGAGADATVQLLQRALRIRVRIPRRVLEPLAVGCGGVVDSAAGRCRALAISQPGLWHRAAYAGPVGRVRGDGQRRALVQRGEKAVATTRRQARRLTARTGPQRGTLMDSTAKEASCAHESCSFS